LSYNGVVPYYLFLCRPTVGNEPYVVPVEKALEIFEEARRNLAGLAKQASFACRTARERSRWWESWMAKSFFAITGRPTQLIVDALWFSRAISLPVGWTIT
jgi:L-lysine 2,3-aminomutase